MTKIADKGPDRPAISFIGAGNVAWHLASHFHDTGFPITEICDRNLGKAKELSTLVSARPCEKISQMSLDCQLLIVSVQDDFIRPVARALIRNGWKDKFIVHTSGVHGTEIFPVDLTRTGVFYMLNTFSRGIPMDLSNTPIFIESLRDSDLEYLRDTASGLSKQIHLRKAEKMPLLHLGAVFVSNFSNLLYRYAEELLSEKDIPFDLLLPLMEQSVKKLEVLKPEQAQTGPAVRGDELTIRKHLELLKDHPEALELYRRFSMLIHPEWKLDL